MKLFLLGTLIGLLVVAIFDESRAAAYDAGYENGFVDGESSWTEP